MNENLRKCEDCGGKVSKRATTCPHCGAPQELLDDAEEEISAEEQDLIDEKRHNEWEKIIKNDSKRPRNNSWVAANRTQSPFSKFINKKIIWQLSIKNIFILFTLLISSFLAFSKYFWESKIDKDYLSKSKNINLLLDKKINSYEYKKALEIIDYYQGIFFNYKDLKEKEELVNYRMPIYKEFKTKYSKISSLPSRTEVWFACIDLKRWHSKGFLEKEFLNAQIELQKRAIKDLKSDVSYDEDKLFLIKRSYIYLNEISNNAYLNEFNEWENKNKKTMEKIIEDDKIYAEQCMRTRIIQSALSSAYYPTSGVPYSNYCAGRASNARRINESAPSKEEPCNYFR